jgi:orotate phosphoribosyltransferase
MNHQKIKRFSTTSGFIAEYFANLKVTTTQVDAYERTEKEFLKIFGRRKYKNFDSFRQIKNRGIRRG